MADYDSLIRPACCRFHGICPVRQVLLFASVDFSPGAVHIRPGLQIWDEQAAVERLAFEKGDHQDRGRCAEERNAQTITSNASTALHSVSILFSEILERQIQLLGGMTAANPRRRADAHEHLHWRIETLGPCDI